MDYGRRDSYRYFDPPRRKGWLVWLVVAAVIGIGLFAAVYNSLVEAGEAPSVEPTPTRLATTMIPVATVINVPPGNRDDMHRLNALGKEKLAQGDPETAAVQFRAAIQADPTFYEPYNNLAFILYENGLYAEAETHWRKALALDATSPDANAGLAIALFAQGDQVQALDFYRRAIGFNQGYFDLGWMQYERLWGPHALATAAEILALLN